MDSITSKEVDWVSGIVNVLLLGKEGTDCCDQVAGTWQSAVPRPSASLKERVPPWLDTAQAHILEVVVC